MLGLFAPHSLWPPVRETFKTVTSLLRGRGGGGVKEKARERVADGIDTRPGGIIARPGSNKRVEFRKRVTVEGGEEGGERESLYFSVKNLIAVNREREEWNNGPISPLLFWIT